MQSAIQKGIIALIMTVGCLAFSPAAVWAADPAPAPATPAPADAGGGTYGPEDNDPYGTRTALGATQGALPYSVAGSDTVPGIIGKVVAVILSFIGIIFFLLVLFAGFMWMSAMGNSERVTKAKDILEAAAIGLLIVLGAYAITRFVFQGLSQSGATSAGPAGEAAVNTCSFTYKGQNTTRCEAVCGNGYVKLEGKSCSDVGKTCCVLECAQKNNCP